MTDSAEIDKTTGSEIAVIGMAGRFPGARSVAEFWENLANGVESISFFTDEELEASGIHPSILREPNYVKAKGTIEDIDKFDATFFGFTPREAEITDPQQRLFLECAWQALEDAGYDPSRYEGLIGAYAGVSTNTYIFNLYLNPDLLRSVGGFETVLGNDKDFLSTRVSYKLGLRGPSFTVQTACSTSLVATHLACQGLLSGECDMALAGGVSVNAPQKSGYLYQEEGIASPDGHCRAFDARAEGTVSGNGVGIVVLKRLEEAIADGDNILALVRSSALNNDGSLKIGYTAPSVEGQAEVIRTAHVMAGIDADTVTYIETHGTGTALGDPVEIAALTRAFRASTEKNGFCAIGSVKTNIGHLDAAAGVAGFIKTVLALKHRMLPPSLHFERPNPKIDFENSPFYVSSKLSAWQTRGHPRRAGVSSFGIGGTNVHVILDEAPPRKASGASRPWHLLLLSAKSGVALDAATINLANYLEEDPEVKVADVAYTLQVGRKPFNHRRAILCKDAADALTAIESLDAGRVLTGAQKPKDRPVVFMFPGGGTQYPNMGRELYEREPAFKEQVDLCAEALKSWLGRDIRHLLYPDEGKEEESAALLRQTSFALPALFTTEYALAKTFIRWGIRPTATIGHSLGEYVSACLAGVFSLEDALALVATRGRLMAGLEGGAMLSVPLAERMLRPLLGPRLSIAAINGPSLCVVSGPVDAIEALEAELFGRAIEFRRLHIEVASHSAVVEPILKDFTDFLTRLRMNAPQTPFISNVTGARITDAEATSPSYWARHLRQTVRFADGLSEVLQDPDAALLEVGPGQALGTLAKQHPDRLPDHAVLSSMRSASDPDPDELALMKTLGRLWLCGVEVDWSRLHAGQLRHRLPLPTYPFERQSYWIDRKKLPANHNASRRRLKVADWLYAPCWKRSTHARPGEERGPDCAVVFVDQCDFGSKLVEKLADKNISAVTVSMAECFACSDSHTYAINPKNREDYIELLKHLRAHKKTPDTFIHMWTITPADEPPADRSDDLLDTGFNSLLFLAQALGDEGFTHPIQIEIVSNGIHEVTGEEAIWPEKATVLGPCKVIPHEYPNIACRSIDITLPPAGSASEERLFDLLLAELLTKPGEPIIAYRGAHRWRQTFEQACLDEPDRLETRLRRNGVYLITGGLGGIGLELAEHLARSCGARLVLVGRSNFPAREEWQVWAESHPGDDPISLKIGRLQAIESLGGEALVKSADTTDVEQMREVVRAACERFGPINGVIHAAGVPGGGMIQLKAPEAARSVLAPKVKGARVLGSIFKDTRLDFFILCSSLNSILGTFGHVDYCAANAFLDSFASCNAARNDSCTLSIDWDRWQGIGMAVAVEQMHKNLTGEDLGGGMKAGEGLEAFDRILSSDRLKNVIVSMQDFNEAVRRSLAPAALNPSAATEPPTPSTSGHARPALTNPYVAPRNELELTITAIWQELLGIGQIGVHDDFSELGGHSLLATRLISRVRSALNVEIQLKRLFDAPTIAGLAEGVRSALDSQQGARSLPLSPASREGRLPLSYAQQRLWFIDQLEPGSPAYNIPTAVLLRGRLHVGALQKTLDEILRRHEVLRTGIGVIDGEPVQVISPAGPMAMPTIDLSDLPESPRSAELRRLASGEAKMAFDLSRGPMLRATLVRLDEPEHAVLFTMHHIASDGWSMGILTREVAALYEAFSMGQDSPLPELPIQYADYAVWQREWLEGEVFDEQLSYWTGQLKGASPLTELPADRPRPPVQSYKGAMHIFSLSAELSHSLKDLSRREEATLFMTLLAALKVLLYRYTGQEDIVITTSIANRTQLELEGLIGFFVNTLALRTDLSGGPSFRDVLSRVREVTMGAYAHQDMPFQTVIEALDFERDASYSPFLQVMLVLQNTPHEALKLPGLNLSLLRGDSGTARIDLLLTITEGPEELTGALQFNTDLFNASTIDEMARSFQTLLEGVVENPDEPISSIPLMTEEESMQLVYEFNEE
jgi:acyl transferase domain-containing protein